MVERLRDAHAATDGLTPLLEEPRRARSTSRYLTRPLITEYLYAPFQDFNTEHINHFSQGSLRALASQYGLGPVFESKKVIRSSATSFYPDICGVFRSRQRACAPPYAKDELVERIKLYIAASNAMMTEMSNRLNHDLADTDGVVVWGVGQLTMKMLKYSPLGSARIVAFADSSPVNRGRELHGVKIVGPEDLRTMSHPIRDCFAASPTRDCKQIRSMNLPNRLIVFRENPEVPFDYCN